MWYAIRSHSNQVAYGWTDDLAVADAAADHLWRIKIDLGDQRIGLCRYAAYPLTDAEAASLGLENWGEPLLFTADSTVDDFATDAA
ncbi:hypothetical protein [Acetobacter sp. DsW_063]|uniref:hypothetical protein n=1 Tax=Acetobacter sp. DsW_063 TaxID=1514894 RepID=UPI000A38C48F|nr:hypothetical protein [Acetobacter sp. DsW_063]OUJ16470.1 hypothetical protein HK28_12365 [Acetobacter sp. DsW_063]